MHSNQVRSEHFAKYNIRVILHANISTNAFLMFMINYWEWTRHIPRWQ